MSKLLYRIRQNAVWRFWFTYMLVFLIACAVCLVGFNSMFSLLRQDAFVKSYRLMTQGVQATDTMIENMARIGTQFEDSDAIQVLHDKFPSHAFNRFKIYNALLEHYANIGNYYDGSLLTNAFLYLNTRDKVIYNISVYPKDIFQSYTSRWQLDVEDWLTPCISGHQETCFVRAGNGQLLYILPCSAHDPASREILACLVFVLDENLLLGQMPFLENFSRASYFMYENGELLFASDELFCLDSLRKEYYTTPGIYEQSGNVILSVEGEGKRIYVTVLPLDETTPELRSLRLFIFLLLLGVATAEAAIAYGFAFRSGKPVNEIARTLHEALPSAKSENETYSTDLSVLNQSVTRVVEEHKQSQPALRKSFFHSLLKGSFVSNSEMLHTAQQAGLELAGSLYCAASLRLFDGMDFENINSDTVNVANQLQQSVGEKLAQYYEKPFWFYQHNILTGFYIIEVANDEDLENLISALTAIVQWLAAEHEVKSRWGVGMPCNDLMQFWKSAEEANSMLEIEGLSSEVNLYLDYPAADNNYYLPYSVEDRLAQGLRSANTGEVESALNLIWEENFHQRTLTRKNFERLNVRITAVLSEQAHLLRQKEQFIDTLSALDQASREGARAWYAQLESLCLAFCKQLIHDKSRQHSDKINAVLEFIQQNYTNPDMGLSMVGGYFNLSDAYLSTLFKAELKINFADYLETLRIDAACKMLDEGCLVANIAEAVGYNSVQSFRRAFKRVKGVSPSAYRQ